MARSIASLALLVRDYGEAIVFFTESLGFSLQEDTPLGGGKRWVRVALAARLALLRTARSTPRPAPSRRGP